MDLKILRAQVIGIVFSFMATAAMTAVKNQRAGDADAAVRIQRIRVALNGDGARAKPETVIGGRPVRQDAVGAALSPPRQEDRITCAALSVLAAEHNHLGMDRILPRVELALHLGGAVDPAVGPESRLCVQVLAVGNDIEIEVVVLIVVGNEIVAVEPASVRERKLINSVDGAKDSHIVFVRLQVILQTFVTTPESSLVL